MHRATCTRSDSFGQDPIGFKAGDENLYRYVGNGPGNGVDPDGLHKDDFQHRVMILLGGMDPTGRKWQYARQAGYFVYGGSGKPQVEDRRGGSSTMVIEVRGGTAMEVAKQIYDHGGKVTHGSVDPDAYVDEALARIREKRKEVGAQLEEVMRSTVRTLPGGEGAIFLERVLNGTVVDEYGPEVAEAWQSLVDLPQSAWENPHETATAAAAMYLFRKRLRKHVDTPGVAASRFSKTTTPWQRTVYQRPDINWDFTRPDGLTNRQAARQGYSPMRVNPETGKWDNITLHHLNDEPRGGVVETWRSTHGRFHRKMSREPNPWRTEHPDWARAWDNEQSAYWRWRTGAYNPAPTDRLRLPGDQ